MNENRNLTWRLNLIVNNYKIWKISAVLRSSVRIIGLINCNWTLSKNKFTWLTCGISFSMFHDQDKGFGHPPWTSNYAVTTGWTLGVPSSWAVAHINSTHNVITIHRPHYFDFTTNSNIFSISNISLKPSLFRKTGLLAVEIRCSNCQTSAQTSWSRHEQTLLAFVLATLDPPVLWTSVKKIKNEHWTFTHVSVVGPGVV